MAPRIIHLACSKENLLGYSAHLKSKSPSKLDEGCDRGGEPNAPNQEILEEALGTKYHSGEGVLSEQFTDNAEQGTTMGAISLITGTSIGCGILALPARTAPAGFIPSAVSMVVCWGFLVLEALLLAEVNVALRRRCETSHVRKGNSEVISLRTMAEQTLGRGGGVFAALNYIFLAYTTMVAYIAKSGDVLSCLAHLPTSITGPLFTCIFSILVLIGGTKFTDKMNQLLTASLMGLFLLIVAVTTLLGEWTGLDHMNWDMVPQTIPVILFSLVYHDLIPVLCAYLDGDISRIRISIFVGSTVPLAAFLIWDIVFLGLAPSSGGEDPLDVLSRLGGIGVSLMIQVFSLLAIATSLIGTLLGMSEFFMEQLSRGAGNIGITPSKICTAAKEFTMSLHLLRKMTSLHAFQTHSERSSPSIIVGAYRIAAAFEKWWIVNGLRFASFALVIVPPLLASSKVAETFFTATDIAGAYGMTTLYGIFPPAMVWALNVSNDKLPSGASSTLVVPGGRVALAGIGICACGIILEQLFLDSMKIPFGSIVDVGFVTEISKAISTLY